MFEIVDEYRGVEIWHEVLTTTVSTRDKALTYGEIRENNVRAVKEIIDKISNKVEPNKLGKYFVVMTVATAYFNCPNRKVIPIDTLFVLVVYKRKPKILRE